MLMIVSFISKKVQELQCEHLRMIYQDISSRSHGKGITRQQFDIFFHLNGLWSTSLYKRFDKNNKGFVSVQQFSETLLLIGKGTFQEKSETLYQIYSSGQNGGVSFDTLTKMVRIFSPQFYSYPKSEINKLIVQEKFMKTLDAYQITYCFDVENKIKDNVTLEPHENNEPFQDKIKSVKILSLEEVKKMGQNLPTTKKKISQNSTCSTKQNESNELKSMLLHSMPSFQVDQKPKQRKNSECLQSKMNTKNLKLISNITFLVKKYVAYLFKTFGIENKSKSLNLQQFKTLLKNHEKIFDMYFEAFHTYIWHYDKQGFPIYKHIKENFSSPAQIKKKGDRFPCYLLLIKTTLFIFNNKNDKKPIQIKNLQGLHIKEIDTYGHGIAIFHRDGIYPEQQYVFQSEQLLNQWMIHLNDYRKGNVIDDFQFLDMVGTGKFAQVFYGKERSTNKQVAIKVIEKNKLSKFERQAIQKQCSILKLCHHPNIIKFINHYETKQNQYIVTQFLSEGDLFQYVKEKVFLQQYQSAIVFKQLLQSIQYLNELGLIHRDLKPENVMIQLNQQKSMVKKIKLIDFGFAVFKKQLEIIPVAEKFAGTPGFMAPEVLNGQDFNESADMFSLGIILYFMLSGYLPFYSPIYEEIVEQTKLCNISLRNSHWSNISKPAKNLVLGLLTFQKQRLTLKQVMENQWLKNIQVLKQYNGINRRLKRK